MTAELLCSGTHPGEMEGSHGRCLSICPDAGLQSAWALEMHTQPCLGQAVCWQVDRRRICKEGVILLHVSLPAVLGSSMTLWNGSFPFYPGANACFPFDTTWAVIISVFLSMLATFIIILPGIRGRGVSEGAGGAQPSGPCPMHPTRLLLPSLENRLGEQTCPHVHSQGSVISSKPWG